MSVALSKRDEIQEGKLSACTQNIGHKLKINDTTISVSEQEHDLTNKMTYPQPEHSPCVPIKVAKVPPSGG